MLTDKKFLNWIHFLLINFFRFFGTYLLGFETNVAFYSEIKPSTGRVSFSAAIFFVNFVQPQSPLIQTAEEQDQFFSLEQMSLPKGQFFGMEMFAKGRKYFRFRFTPVLAFVSVLVFLLTSPTNQSALTVPNGCTEVAIYLKDWNGGNVNSLDVKLVNHFITCIQDLYKIYEKTDWKAVQKMIPQNVRDLVRKISNLTRNATFIAKGKEMGCLAVYMLYRTFDMYDQAMSLDLDYQSYRQEFQLLQMELKHVTYFINKELIPLRDHPGWATLGRKTTHLLLDKLSRINDALVQLIRPVYNSLKESASKRRWAALSGLISMAACVGALVFGNAPGGVACAATAYNGLSYASLSSTMNKLEWLLMDVKMMAMEIEEYRTILEQMPTYGVSELFLVITCTIGLWLLFQHNAQVPQDYPAMADLE